MCRRERSTLPPPGKDQMIRRTAAIILLISAIILLIAVPVFAFTPLGTRLLGGSGSEQAFFIPSPTFLPFTPTPPPKPTPILTAKGMPAAMTANEAMLLDNDT